jgi:hypothetical protein
MVDTSKVGAQKADEQPAWVSVTRAAFDRVTQQFLKSAKIDLSALGPLAKIAADEVYKMLESAAKQDGRVKSELVLAGYQQLRHAHTRDQSAGFDVGDPPAVTAGVNGKIPTGKRDQWAKPLDKGRFELFGLIGADHLVHQLAKKVGLDPKSLPEAAMRLIEEFGQSAKWGNLTDSKVWKELGTKLREMALDEGVTGGPKTVNVRRTMENATPVLPKDLEPTAQQQGLGLKKTATDRTNTGSKTNGTAIRAQLLTGLKSSANVDQAATSLADALFKDLKVGDVSNGLKSEVISALKEALKDPTSPDGSVRPLEVLASSYRILLGKLPADHPKASFQLGLQLAEGLAQLTRGQTISPGLERAFAEMSLWGLSDLTTTILGKPPQNFSENVQKKLFGILGQLGKNSTLAKALLQTAEEQAGVKKKPAPEAQAQQTAPKPKAEKTENAEEAKTASEAKAAPDEALVKRAVRNQLRAMQVRMDDPRAQALEAALTDVMKKGVDPGSIAINGYEWIVNKTGLFRTHLEQIREQVPMRVEAADKAFALLKSLQVEHDAATAKLGETKDPKERERIEGDIKRIEQSADMARNMLEEHVEPLQLYQNEAIKLIAQYCMSPGGFRSVYDKGGAGDGGAGGGGGGGPGGPDGPDHGGRGGGGGGDDGEPNWFRRDKPTRFGLPGIFSGGGPNDNPEDMTLQQQRALKCSAILADPSLSIEDKIFLFMMWFVAFTDREREKQLEDIVGMDSRQAQRSEAIEKQRQKEKSQRMELARATEDLRGAQKEREAAKAGPGGENSDAYKDANRRCEEAEGKVKGSRERIDEINADINKMRRDSDSAPQSREVKFTELQRLSQLRDNILNMARSIMETSNRNIEKVFR